MKRVAAPMVGGLVTSFAAGAARLPGDLTSSGKGGSWLQHVDASA